MARKKCGFIGRVFGMCSNRRASIGMERNRDALSMTLQDAKKIAEESIARNYVKDIPGLTWKWLHGKFETFHFMKYRTGYTDYTGAIEITAPGYRTYKMWVNVDPEDGSVMIR